MNRERAVSASQGPADWSQEKPSDVTLAVGLLRLLAREKGGTMSETETPQPDAPAEEEPETPEAEGEEEEQEES